ncbi:MAG: hypothetical protein RR390_19800 [Hafnia sp.]
MSEFKGTPGPWEMKKEKGEPEWFVFQKGSMKKMCGGTIRTPVAEEINNKHDAKLISAAPELLEALQDFMAESSGNSKSCGHDFECICRFDKASAAIAKALGK